MDVNKLHEFLDKAGYFFIATTEGNQPRLRPFGAHYPKDGKEYFTVGDKKAVYRQMIENPLVEIVALTPNDMRWLRFTGKAVFEDDDALREEIFEANPSLRNEYPSDSEQKMALFRLEDATAKIINPDGSEEIL